MNYWLMKSEPHDFSIEDLERCPHQVETWDGVRNYQARNMMRDRMHSGDLALFYRSNCPQPGVVGIMAIQREAYPDPSAFDRQDKHYDPKSDAARPRWYTVDVHLVRKLRRTIPLAELKQEPQLADMPLLRRGNRLSVMPVTKAQWDHILSME